MNEQTARESYIISLRVTHPTLSAPDICKALGVIARVSQSVGEPRATPKGNKLDGLYEKTFITTPIIPKTSGELTEGLERAAKALSKNKNQLGQIAKSGGQCELFVGLFCSSSTGFTIDRTLMRELIECSVDICVDAYLENY